MESTPDSDPTVIIQMPLEPYFTPTQIEHRNACSHQCDPIAPGPVSFYIYPCKNAHLSHPSCFLLYCSHERAKGSCEFCIKEFGFEPSVQEKELQRLNQKRCISAVALTMVLFVLITTCLYIFLWPKQN